MPISETPHWPFECPSFSVFKLRVFVLDMAQRNRVTEVGYFMKANTVLPLAIAALLAGCTSMPKSDVYTYRSDIGGPGLGLLVDKELGRGRSEERRVGEEGRYWWAAC